MFFIILLEKMVFNYFYKFLGWKFDKFLLLRDVGYRSVILMRSFSLLIESSRIFIYNIYKYFWNL